MAKGDSVEVMVTVGDAAITNRMVASKAGRTIRTKTATMSKAPWLVVEELTRTGRPTGITHRYRMEVVVGIREHKVDEAEQTAIRRRAVKAKVPTPASLGLLGYEEEAENG